MRGPSPSLHAFFNTNLFAIMVVVELQYHLLPLGIVSHSKPHLLEGKTSQHIPKHEDPVKSRKVPPFVPEKKKKKKNTLYRT